MSVPHLRLTTAAAAVALVSAALLGSGAATAANAAPKAPKTQPATAGNPNLLNLQILSFNDFHGNLEPPAGSSGRIIVSDNYRETSSVVNGNTVYSITADTVNAGGVSYLATHLARARQGHPDTVTVAAGDIVGASPLLSAAFHDEPSIEAMNNLGLEATAVGNHEFDEGYKEIQRLAAGVCLDDGDGKDNQDSCPQGHQFTGADFTILAANVKYAGTDQTILPGTWVKTFPNGAKVGFIGMTLKETPSIVTQAGIEGLEFTDEVTTANAAAKELMKQGVKAIVVLLHQGATPLRNATFTGAHTSSTTLEHRYDWACDLSGDNAGLDPTSAVLPIAENLSPQIDMIISGHTHQPYVCDIPDPDGNSRLVTSASSFGRLFTETDLQYNAKSRDIVRESVHASNQIVTRTVTPDATENSLIAMYKQLIAPIATKVIGTIGTPTISRSKTNGESPLGDLIADSQRSDPSVVKGTKVPQIAFMNPGGIRADLITTDPTAPYDVTYEQAFTVQPFNNYVVSMDMTGAQIKDLLVQQWSGPNSGAANEKFLEVSDGFRYEYSGAAGSRALGAVTYGGQPLGDATVYRVVANSFLSDGGDNFPAFKLGQDKLIGGLDIDSLAGYLTAHPGYQPLTPGTRIVKTG